MKPFNINESKRILKILEMKEKNQFQTVNDVPRTGLETKNYLFYFKGIYHFIESGKYRKLSESEVRLTLEKNSETKIYFICSEHVCPMPSTLAAKEKEGVKVANDTEAANFISKTSGIEVRKEDL